MKKKYIQLGILAAVFLCVLGAFLILNRQPAQDIAESSAAEKIFVVGGSSALKPTQIDVKNESGSYSIIDREPQEDKSDLTIKGWDEISLDSYALGQAKTSAGAMEAKLIVAENAEASRLSDYGLDKPRAEAVIRYSDNSSAEIQIGADAPGGEGVYVKRAGDNSVYLVSSTTAGSFLKPDTDYVNKTVTETDPDFKGFDRIMLSGTNYPEPIVIIRTPETTLEAGGVTFNTHSITTPVKASLDSDKGLTPLVTVYGLTSDEVLAVIDDKTETLEKYGLLESAAVISVKSPEDVPALTFELRVSKPDDDGSVNVIKTGSPVVYKLDKTLLPWLDLTVFDMMEKVAIMPNITSISSVKLVLSDKSYDFTLTGEDDDLVVSLNGKELTEVVKADGAKASGVNNFKQFYQTMISARYESPADEPVPEGEPQIARIEYHYKDGKAADVVTFYAGPTRKAFIRLNDGKTYLCQSVYVDRLLEDAAKIASGEAVKSFI